MKPKICELLDVEIDEEFYFRDKDELYRITKIERSGEYCLQRNCDGGDEDQWFPAETEPLIGMIDYPEEIVKKPRWNSKDIKDAKAIKQLFPTCKSVYRDGYGLTIVYEKLDSICSHTFYTGSNILPTLRIADGSVKIKDIKEVIWRCSNETKNL